MEKIEVKEQEDSIQVKIKENDKVITVRYLSKDMYNLLTQEAKRELIDDVKKLVECHLPTLPKGKAT